MRKRLRDEIYDKDKSASHRGGGKQRQKLKSSERLARELELCDRTLIDAKRSYEQLVALNLSARQKRQSGSIDLQPLPLIPVTKMSPPARVEHKLLPLPAPSDADHLDFHDPQTPASKHKSREMVDEEQNLASRQSFAMQYQQSPELPCCEVTVAEVPNLLTTKVLPCPEVAAAEASKVLTSFLHRLTEHGILLHHATAPNFVKDIFKGYPGGVTQGIDARSDKTPGQDESKEAQPACLGFCKELVAEASEDAQPMKESMDIQAEKPPCLEICKEAQFAEDLKANELKEQEKPLFLKISGCQEASEGAKHEEQQKLSSLLSQQEVGQDAEKVETEEACALRFSAQVAEEPKEAECEEPLSSKFSREFNEERKEVKADKRQHGHEALMLGSGGKVLFESDVEDDDGLKQLWDDMEFSFACMNETQNSQSEAKDHQNEGCIHDFYRKNDMGLVCSKCGLIGQDAEYIFDYVWGEKSRKRHTGNEPSVMKRTAKWTPQECSSELLEDLSVCMQKTEHLVLHPQYKEKLQTHQEEGVRFLEHNLVQDEPSGCILAHAPGTGKSFTVIAFLQSFQTAYPHENPLIVAPKGMLCVWAREFHKWKVEDIPIFNLHEAKSIEGDEYISTDALVHQQKRHCQLQMLRQWKAEKSILMVGYSMFSTLTGERDAVAFPEIKQILLETPGILILDEGHFPRNKKAQITQSLSQIRTKRRVLLSGTLFQNNFVELYNLYHLVKPDFMSSNASCTKSLLENYMNVHLSPANGVLTSSKSPRKKSGREAVELDMFKNMGETITSGEKESKSQAISQLRQLSEPFVHWYKGQILADLPGLIDLTLFLKLTDKQQELLSSLPTKGDKQLDFYSKSMRICIHPVLLKVDSDAAQNNELQWNGIEVDPKSSSKIMFILDLLQVAVPMKEKVVLFSRFLDPFHLLERVFKKVWRWSLNKEILRIDGRTSLEERESIIDRFNEDPKARILLASIKTCGEGVSLIGASRVVILDVQWNPMVSRQAVSRAFRLGQKKKVFVYRLVGAESTEEGAHFKSCKKEWLAKLIFEGCNDEDYGMYCHEVNPQEVDIFFESQNLQENVLRCFRYRFA